MIEVRFVTEAAPDRPVNEDHAFVVPGFVGVLDGVTAPHGLDTGCVHGPAWYVARLAGKLIEREAADPSAPLATVLGDAITAVRTDHGDGCDLDHAGTPAATVCLLRTRGEVAEYLVLGDSPLVAERPSGITVVNDDRLAGVMGDVRQTALSGDAPPGAARHADPLRSLVTAQRAFTNQEHGYWIAAATSEAASRSITGTLPLTGPDRLRRAALLTDGASSAVEEFGLVDWSGLLDLLTERGPGDLIRRVRQAESSDPDGHRRRRLKRYDDATAVLCLFG